MSEPFDLVCYIQPHWRPRIRAAAHRRDWMDATREAFAYRCLPLNIANAHGWELLAGCGFEAVWNGGPEAQDVSVTADAGSDAQDLPVTLFGHGVLTFHVEGLLRTPPGWNLWLGGPPNRPKDGIAALGGVIETDWSPYTFTMNWRFTRPGQRVRFEAGEPIGFSSSRCRATCWTRCARASRRCRTNPSWSAVTCSGVHRATISMRGWRISRT